MRIAFLVSFATCVALAISVAGCSTTRVITQGGDAGPGDQSDLDGGGGNTLPETCAPSEVAVVLSATILGRPSLDFAASRLGFGYVDIDGVPTVKTHDVATSKESTARWSPAVAYDKYGASYIRTSLAHNGQTFGFGWYTEAPRKTSDSTWSTRFGTVSAASGEQTSAENGNDDYGRADADDMVQAIDPDVTPFGGGFLMTWRDRRTKEPIELNTNVAGWQGIYARSFDGSGQGASSDMQIAQPAGVDSITAVTDGTKVMPIWTYMAADYQATVHARPGTKFTPAEPPAPVAEFRSESRPHLTAAHGPDGNVLVVVERAPELGGPPVLGSLVTSMSGSEESAYADWDDGKKLSQPSLAATTDGYVLAAYEVSDDGEIVALRMFWLDGDGKRLSDSRTKLTLPAATRLGRIAIGVRDRTVRVAFPTAAESDFASANEPFDTQVRAITACTP